MKFHFLYLVVTISLLGISCSNSNNISKGLEKNWLEEGYFSAIVQDLSNLDGCSFLIYIVDEDIYLNPTNGLSENFKKDKSLVWVKYSLDKTSSNICMKGKSAIIKDIQERKD